MVDGSAKLVWDCQRAAAHGADVDITGDVGIVEGEGRSGGTGPKCWSGLPNFWNPLDNSPGDILPGDFPLDKIWKLALTRFWLYSTGT